MQKSARNLIQKIVQIGFLAVFLSAGKPAAAAKTCEKILSGAQSVSHSSQLAQKTICDIPCLESPEIKGADLPEKKIHELYIQKKIDVDEMAKRLIFAETMAAGSKCLQTENMDALVKTVAQVILNRMNSTGTLAAEFKIPGDNKTPVSESVLFKPQQFRSSFGGYDVAQRKAMLCPLNAEFSGVINPSSPKGSEELWVLVNRIYHQLKENPDPKLKNSYFYFFNSHFTGSSLEAKYGGKKPIEYTPTNTLTGDALGLRNDLCIMARKN